MFFSRKRYTIFMDWNLSILSNLNPFSFLISHDFNGLYDTFVTHTLYCTNLAEIGFYSGTKHRTKIKHLVYNTILLLRVFCSFPLSKGIGETGERWRFDTSCDWHLAVMVTNSSCSSHQNQFITDQVVSMRNQDLSDAI